MTAAEWIAKRRELTMEATVGPWEWLAYGGGMQLVRHNAPYHDHNILKTTDDWPPFTQLKIAVTTATVLGVRLALSRQSLHAASGGRHA